MNSMKFLIFLVINYLLVHSGANAALNWIQKVSGVSSNLDTVVYNGTKFVGCASGNSQSLTSSDGEIWSANTLSNVWIDALAIAGNTFIGVGTQGRIYTSSNGQTWTLRLQTGSNLFDVAVGNDIIVAVGSSGAILRSSDFGITWQVAASPTSRVIYCVTYGAGQFLALSYDSTWGCEVLRSSDGLSWQLISMAVDSGAPYPLTLAYGNGVFMTNNYRSTDAGVTWKKMVAYSGSWDSRICYGNNTFVAVRSSGGIQYSINGGVSWVNSTSNVSANLNDVEFGRGTWVIVGDNGVILTAIDPPPPSGITDLAIRPAVRLTWPTQRGIIYKIQYSTDMIGWSDLGHSFVGDGNEKEFFESTQGNTNRFYRVMSQ